jgi:hypothetical protein
MPTNIIEGGVASDWLKREADSLYSREQGLILSGQGALVSGTILGKVLNAGGAITVGAAVAGGGNVGNGTFGAITADAGAPAGNYRVVIIEPAANAGAFQVFLPSGVLDGTGNVAAPYNGTINFTLADGGTDFAAGDTFTIPVTIADPASLGKLKKHTLAATDGSQIPAGILMWDVDATNADAKCVYIARDALVAQQALTYGADVDNATKRATVNAGLRALNPAILVREGA